MARRHGPPSPTPYSLLPTSSLTRVLHDSPFDFSTDLQYIVLQCSLSRAGVAYRIDQGILEWAVLLVD